MSIQRKQAHTHTHKIIVDEENLETVKESSTIITMNTARKRVAKQQQQDIKGIFLAMQIM